MAAKSTGTPDHPQQLTPDEIKELVRLVSETGVEEVEVENGDFRLRIVGKSAPAPVIASATAVPSPPVPSPGEVPVPVVTAQQEAPPSAAAVEDDDKCENVKSPMVGTFYRSPAPDSPPFVQVGDRVDANTVLCIVEAMKLMNEIKAEMAGTVRRVLVENGQPVEYGQPLYAIEPA